MPELICDLPMRWADLDELSHVNNVVYLDYAAEARAVHVAAGELADDEPTQVGVEFLRPLLLSRTPVRVRSRLDDGVLVQELGPATADVAFARVVSRSAPVVAEGPGSDPGPRIGEPYGVRVRRSDLGADGRVELARVFEYTQEARISTFSHLREESEPHERIVVARVDVTLGEPFAWRTEEYRADTHLVRLGTSSCTVRTFFEDGRHGRADAVLVGFDLRPQRSRPLPAHARGVRGG